MDKKKLLKFAKMVLSLEQTETDKGVLIHEGELAVGAEVFIEDENGELQIPEDGEYASDGKIIIISEGKVAEIRDKEPEPEPAKEPEPEQQKMDAEEEAEKDAKIAELEAELEAKNVELADKDAKIAELEAELEDLKAKLAESDARSAEEELKMSNQKPTGSKIKFDLF